MTSARARPRRWWPAGECLSLADLRAIASLVPLGVEGAIVGTALYEGAFTLTEALAEVAASS